MKEARFQLIALLTGCGFPPGKAECFTDGEQKRKKHKKRLRKNVFPQPFFSPT